jgi:NAD(P)-dependent dehydrogenase (short-subunit alcohol dehydrogenase family)
MEALLKNKVAVVAGATRGAGRGIAVELGRAGATVYCTGRSTKNNPSDLNRPETIEETAEVVTKAGGVGIAVRVDHTKEAEVQKLFEQVKQEQHGQLDILVNDIWGGDSLTEWGKPFWELDLGKGFKLLERAIFTHIITSKYALPLMLQHKQGLIIEVTDGDTLNYRGNFFYDLAKTTVIRLAHNIAAELSDDVGLASNSVSRIQHGITAVALTPGFLRSEEMLEHFEVTESTWRDAIKKDPYFAESETPHYIGRAVVALASDPHVHSKHGKALATWHLSREYNFKDIDGRQPHWQAFYDSKQKM